MATESNTLKIERVFEAPVEKVWHAWTEEAEIKKWHGPAGFTAPHIKNDFRIGGKYLYAMHGPAGTEWDKDIWSTGEFKEIIPLKKIVATDSFADAEGNIISAAEYGMQSDFPKELLVTVEFEPANGKTKLTLRHEGMPPGEIQAATTGWNESLDKLAKTLKA